MFLMLASCDDKAHKRIELCQISSRGGLERVMGLTKNGGEVLVTKDGKLFSNIPSSQRTLDLHIRSLLYLDTYVESFVLLNVAVCWWSFGRVGDFVFC